MATKMIGVPALVSNWLADQRIELDPAGDPLQAIYAEWNPTDGVLHLAWWEQDGCPRCKQADRPMRSVIAPEGFDSENWQHGCGEWWEPYSTTVEFDGDIAANEDLYVEKLTEALKRVKDRQNQAVEGAAEDLRKSLLGFLIDYPTEEERQANATGSELEPGIWYNDAGELEAWAYDPTGADGEWITVTADDVKTTYLMEALSAAYRDLHAVMDNRQPTARRMSRTTDKLAKMLRLMGSSAAEALDGDGS